MPIKLSLICPIYKVAEYLPQLMQSLLEGVNSESVEIIFVDDCCPENSILICEEFIEIHKHDIKFQSNIIKLSENKGLSGARNVALDVATGSYIGFIDSDDAIASTYYKTLEHYIELASHDIIEFGYSEFSNKLPVLDEAEEVHELASTNLNPFHTGFFVWTRLFKRELVSNLRFPDGMLYEDVYFNMHTFANAKHIVRINARLLYYRQREGAITALRDSGYSHLLINFIHSIEQTIQKYPDQKEICSLLLDRILLLSLKGLKINDKADRKEYYKLCYPELARATILASNYDANLKAKISLFLSRIICRALK